MKNDSPAKFCYTQSREIFPSRCHLPDYTCIIHTLVLKHIEFAESKHAIFTLAGDGTEQTRGIYTYYLTTTQKTTKMADHTEPDTSEQEIQIYINKKGKYLTLTPTKMVKKEKKVHKKYYNNNNANINEGNDSLTRKKRTQRDVDSTIVSKDVLKKGRLHEPTDSDTVKQEKKRLVNETNNKTVNRNNDIINTITKINNGITLYRTLNNFKKSTIARNVEPKTRNRQKRFLQFFSKTDNTDSNDNFIFKALNFLVNNRRKIVPIVSVMREINTIVKSANGELNHVTKENNNFVGINPPEFKPLSYTLELGTDKGILGFVKRLLGLGLKGDKLTIGSK